MRTHLSLVRMDELRETRLQIVQRLGRAAEYKDNETGLHVIRMSHFSQLLALAAGCSPAWAEDLLNAAPMHDVGKIGIRDDVLLHPGRLDEPRMEKMRTHPERGARLFAATGRDDAAAVARLILHHHEAWDGSGYPHGLQGEEIPLEARILTIADGYDALTSRRPYRGPLHTDDALAILNREKNRLVDARLLGEFRGLLRARARGRPAS